jgi:hypothetical protein
MTTSTSEVVFPDQVASRIETAVTIESESHFFLGAAGDVPSGGVFIATARELAVGQSVRVELALHAYVLIFHGTVRWRRAEGVAVGFDGISSTARGVIESFCARRRAAVTYDLDGRALARG